MEWGGCAAASDSKEENVRGKGEGRGGQEAGRVGWGGHAAASDRKEEHLMGREGGAGRLGGERVEGVAKVGTARGRGCNTCGWEWEW